MRKWIRWPALSLLCFALLLPTLPRGQALENTAEAIPLSELDAAQDGIPNYSQLFDGNTVRALAIPDGASLTLSPPQGIGSVYLIFDREYGPYTVTDTESGECRSFGEHGFLHDFLDLEEAFGSAPNSITLSFSSGDAKLNELYAFTPGQPPDFVQRWRPPAEGKTDLLLFSTHGDDEQLFFAGLLPYYAGELDYEVLVAYLTCHRNVTSLRCHEMLNGLWAAGVRTYPVFGPFGDFYCRSKENAYAAHRRAGESEDALLSFVTEQLRRFRPLVAVGHDIHGEYGHGQHQMYADLLCRGVEAAADPACFPELAEKFGVWDVPKTYLHLWPENPISMDWDQPLARFGGMTAFQVSQQLGFPCHASQYGGFTWYIAGYGHASDIPKYSPCEYGLYRSTVGPDTGIGDFFENLTTYAQQDHIAAIAMLQENIRQAHAAASQAALTRQHRAELLLEATRARAQANASRQAAEKWKNITLFLLLLGAAAVILPTVSQQKGRRQ